MNPTSLTWGSVPDIIQAGISVVSIILAIIALLRQQKQEERVRILESELDKAEFEHQTQFAKLHEKRAEVIAELYRQIVVIEIWAKYAIHESELPDEVYTSTEAFKERIDDVMGQISLNLQDLAVYFNMNRLYLDDKLCRQIVNFQYLVLNDSQSSLSGFISQRFGLMPKADIKKFYGSNLKKRAYESLEYISSSRRLIEDDFRRLLGIQAPKDAKEEIEFSDDLMWLPEPEMIDPIEWRKAKAERNEPPEGE